MKHIVSVTMSKKNAYAAWMRSPHTQSGIEVEADSKEEAEKKASAMYKKHGYKIHSASAKVKEQVDEAADLDEALPQIHKIAVTVSSPKHPIISARQDKKEKLIKVGAKNKEDAIEKAKEHFRKSGFKVHSAEHHSTILEGAIDKDHPIVKEYNALKKEDIKTLRNMIKQQSRIVDTSGFTSKDHAISHYLRNKHGDKRVDQAFGFKEDTLNEVTQGVEHSEWADNVKDHYHPTPVRIIKKQSEDGRHMSSHAMVGDKKVGQYNMKTGVGTFTALKKQAMKEEANLDESDSIPSVYQKRDAAGTYHIEYSGKDKDGTTQKKLYKVKANDHHHAQFKVLKIAGSDFPHHIQGSSVTHKFIKEEKMKSFSDFIEEQSCSKTAMIKKAVKKMKEETIEEASLFAHHVGKAEDAKSRGDDSSFSHHMELARRLHSAMSDKEKGVVPKTISTFQKLKEEVEQLDEASMAYHLKKAEEAKARGDVKKFAYHMENARTARYAMTGKEMIRNRHHLDKYTELRDAK